jgi:hypothetical protein
MSTRRERLVEDEVLAYRYPCCGAWWEDGCQCDPRTTLPRAYSRSRWSLDGDSTDSYGEMYDPRQDECPDCGMSMDVCHCRPGEPPYDNGDRMEDVDDGKPMRHSGPDDGE